MSRGSLWDRLRAYLSVDEAEGEPADEARAAHLRRVVQVSDEMAAVRQSHDACAQRVTQLEAALAEAAPEADLGALSAALLEARAALERDARKLRAMQWRREEALRVARGSLQSEGFEQALNEASQASELAASAGAALGAAFDALESRAHCAGDVARATQQLALCDAKVAGLIALLAHKLHSEELTYHRYATLAREVAEGIHAGLAAVLDSLRVLAHIDDTALRDRLASLEGPHRAASDTRLARTLETRLALHASHTARIEALFARNEEALTTLLKATAALAEMPSLGAESEGQLSAAMKDLAALAERPLPQGLSTDGH